MDEIIEKYIKAGKITAQARDESKQWIKPGMKVLEICEKIENRIKELGGGIAFPTNVSINNIAAHYTAKKDDDLIINENDVIKIDVGGHVDGYIGDTAYTKIFNDNNKDLVDSVDKALSEAIKLCTPGRKISEISEVIENTIRDYGFNPISNLTGHGLDQYVVHDEPTIPNIKNNSTYELRENQIIAIEPFATEGVGRVNESSETLIFQFIEKRPVRSPDSRKIVEFAQNLKLPFAERWIPLSSRIKIRLALRELFEKNVLYKFPVLKEASGKPIAQKEHTIIVGDKPRITTVFENDINN